MSTGTEERMSKEEEEKELTATTFFSSCKVLLSLVTSAVTVPSFSRADESFRLRT